MLAKNKLREEKERKIKAELFDEFLESELYDYKETCTNNPWSLGPLSGHSDIGKKEKSGT